MKKEHMVKIGLKSSESGSFNVIKNDIKLDDNIIPIYCDALMARKSLIMSKIRNNKSN